MYEASMIGIDLAKNTFQLHGAQSDGSVAFRRKLTRARVLPFLTSQPDCLVAMEACAGAHHWGREIAELGHEVKLIPPIYVKPFVKGCSYQGTSLRHSKSRGFCPGPGADGNVPSFRLRLTAVDSSPSAGITHGAPLHA